MRRPWIAMFSHTGTEIADLIAVTGKVPVLIIRNENSKRKEDIRLNRYNTATFPRNPKEEDYQKTFSMVHSLYKRKPLITLHGWMRIIPEKICQDWDIYNGYPGLITEYPQLKGKDPQKKAYDLKLSYSGCVVHRVTSKVNEGPILDSIKLKIEDLSLEETINTLRNGSLALWIDVIETLL